MARAAREELDKSATKDIAAALDNEALYVEKRTWFLFEATRKGETR